MKLKLYFHTLRSLRPVQIYSRLWFRFYRPRPSKKPALALRPRAGQWVSSARREPSMIGPSTFTFLNRTRKLQTIGCWNDSAFERLWLYNLHYFDDLNARDAEQRMEWHDLLIQRWILETPPGFGCGWEPYPLSLRIVNWIKWAIAGGRLTNFAIQSLAIQVRYLIKRLEWHLLGNHLLANAKALIFAGLFFTGPEADKWLTKGMNLLSREIHEQILSDGGHFERSPMYHSLTLEDLLDVYNMSKVYPVSFSQRWLRQISAWEETIQKMREWLKVMCHPDGEIAFFNDAACGVAPTLAQLEAYANRLGFGSVMEPEDGVTHLRDSGYIRLQKGDAIVILDVGVIGPDYQPGHAHADTLSFELSLFGQRAVVNSGTSSYENTLERQQQRATAAHNTVVVDSADSSEVWGAFRVAKKAHPVGLEIRGQGDQGLIVSCAHNGYYRLPGRVLHRRTWRLTSCSLEIQDFLDGQMSTAIARFHFHPSLRFLPSPASQEGAVTFYIHKHPVSWVSSGKPVAEEHSTFHPAFGVSLENFCLTAHCNDKGTTHRISWC